MAGAVCVALRADGLAQVNAMHPKLRALVDAGATPDMFLGAWRAAKARGGVGAAFPYVLAAVEGQMREAGAIAAAAKAGAIPAPGQPMNKQQALEARNRAVGEEWVRKKQLEAAQAEHEQLSKKESAA